MCSRKIFSIFRVCPSNPYRDRIFHLRFLSVKSVLHLYASNAVSKLFLRLSGKVARGATSPSGLTEAFAFRSVVTNYAFSGSTFVSWKFPDDIASEVSTLHFFVICRSSVHAVFNQWLSGRLEKVGLFLNFSDKVSTNNRVRFCFLITFSLPIGVFQPWFQFLPGI